MSGKTKPKKHYENHLNQDMINAKLDYIFMRWGVDKKTLDKIIIEPVPLPNVSKIAKHKFKKYLNSLKQVFDSVSSNPEYSWIHDRLEEQMVTNTDYFECIRKLLHNERKFLSYITGNGNWDEDILRAVSIAQKKYMVPKELPSEAEQNPKVSFKPRSEYRRYFDK
jgi:hypothetical protein